MELDIGVAEEAGEQPLTEIEEMKPKKRTDGFWGHKMAHYSDQVKEEEYDGPSVDERIDQEEEAQVEAKTEKSPHPQSPPARPKHDDVSPPGQTQTPHPLT